MKAKIRIRIGVLISYGVVSVLFASGINGQTQINLSSQTRNADFTNFPYTRPMKTGSSLPGTCTVGDFFFNTGAAAGQNIYSCLIANTWVQQGGLQDPGANGLVKRTGPNTSTVVAAPSSSLVGISDTQTLTNKSVDASEINSGVLSPSRLPSLTGDVITSSGSSLTALSTVNNTPGTYGDASHSVQVVVDAKGRVTSINQTAIAATPTSSFYQQLNKNGTSITQRAALNLSNAFSVNDNSSASRTDVDLAQVNSNPGTYGSTSQVPVITVNSYGQITGVSTASVASGSSSSATATSGAFSTIPSSCTAGALYLATDQPLGQQLFTCSSSNNWSPLLSVGPSGALSINGGSLDIVTSVVPRLTSANTFSGLNLFNSGIQLATTGSQGTCNSGSRGAIWYQNNGASKDGLQVCVFNGSAYSWISLY